MTDTSLRMLVWVTLGLALVLILRKPARHLFGAGPAFMLWGLPPALALAPLLPHSLVPAASIALPGLWITPGVPVAAAAGAHFGWTLLPASLWLAGAVSGIVRLAVQYLRLRSGARRGSASWLREMRLAAPGLDLRRVRVHEAGPAVLWALPHSLILLPAEFAERFDNAATRELVLRHELTPTRRGDAWWSLAMEIASAPLWFHPLAWFARPRFRLDQELACDAASLRTAPQRTGSYARALLDSVAVQAAPALIPWLAEPQLKERLAMITRIQPGALRRRAGFLAVAAIVAGGLFVAGGQAPVRAAAPDASSGTRPAVDATFKNSNPPSYPTAAVKKHEQGWVMLNVTVNASGDVQHVAVDAKRSDASPELQQAAMAAAANWKFNPGTKDGKPVGGVVRIPVDFSLGGPKGVAGGSCPVGFQYKQGKGKSYSCISQPSAPASS
jgi:TonB family protein